MVPLTPSAGGSPGLPDLSRRALLRATPAVLVPTLLAAPALALSASPPETPILAMYRELEAIHARWRGADDEASDACDREAALVEARLAAEPVTSFADLCAKVVALTGFSGGFAPPESLTVECKALLAEALA